MTEGERHPRIRVGGIAIREGKLLLVRHEKAGKSYWLLPGGGVNYGEDLEAALRREFKEETNLDVQVGDLVMALDSVAPDGRRHVVNLCFEVDSADGEASVGTDPRVVEVGYVPFERVKALTIHPDMKIELVEGLKNGFENKTYLGTRWRDDVADEPKT